PGETGAEDHRLDPAHGGNLQGVVPLAAAVIVIRDAVEGGIGIPGGGERRKAGGRLVDVPAIDQVHRVASDIRYRDPDALDLALERDVPLLELGNFHVRVVSRDA